MHPITPIKKLNIKQSSIMASPSLVVLHLDSELPGAVFLSLKMLQAQYSYAVLMPVKCLEHILLKLIEYTKSKRAKKMLKDL